MAEWGAYVASRGDPARCPIAGVDAAVLEGVRAPSICLYTFPKQWADGMHTEVLTGPTTVVLLAV